MSPKRVVFDTNVLISAALIEDSTPQKALRSASHTADLLLCPETLEELGTRLMRDKFSRYQSIDNRKRFLQEYEALCWMVERDVSVSDCADPDDNKFLELAVSGQADYLITGDKELLVLDPFRGVEILTPGAYLRLEGSNR